MDGATQGIRVQQLIALPTTHTDFLQSTPLTWCPLSASNLVSISMENFST